MTLYARNDLQLVAIPPSSGGCGHSHSRPVRDGAPDKVFELNCPPCEAYLKGERKPRILRTTPGNPEIGLSPKQERIADADPMWSSTPENIPLTPDEQSSNATRTKRARDQIELIKARAALKDAGINVPFETMWLMEKELPSAFIKGITVCPAGHDNNAGVKFCGECGISMTAQKEIEAVPDDIPLDRLHPATLRKKCRDCGLPDKGTKSQMIARLEAARMRT
jgi:hypothetical protein